MRVNEILAHADHLRAMVVEEHWCLDGDEEMYCELADAYRRLRAALVHDRTCQWCRSQCPHAHSECSSCTSDAVLAEGEL